MWVDLIEGIGWLSLACGGVATLMTLVDFIRAPQATVDRRSAEAASQTPGCAVNASRGSCCAAARRTCSGSHSLGRPRQPACMDYRGLSAAAVPAPPRHL